jgi:hypothetical protein
MLTAFTLGIVRKDSVSAELLRFAKSSILPNLQRNRSDAARKAINGHSELQRLFKKISGEAGHEVPSCRLSSWRVCQLQLFVRRLRLGCDGHRNCHDQAFTLVDFSRRGTQAPELTVDPGSPVKRQRL